MSTDKTNIAQIQKYLSGELDAKAMHALEKQAQDDPFLMDAIEGYQNIETDQQANFDAVKQRFANRTAQGKGRYVVLWRVLPIAATLLIAVGVGLYLFKPSPKQQKQVYTKVVLLPAKVTDGPVGTAPPMADAKHITGLITDATGHALAGVKVAVKGTKLSAKTDTSGHFIIASSIAKGTLRVAANGYDTKNISLKDKNGLNVVLNESASQLASVSVTAYIEDDKPANKTHPEIGWKAFRNYLRKNAFVETGETGLVKLAFTVDTSGTIKGIHVIKGKNEAMNQKAINLILNGPDWKGITKGETHLKIQFRKPKQG